jgi:GxxExxY protein
MENDNLEWIAKLNPFLHKLIGLAIEVHRHLGTGLLESAYQHWLFYEIINAGLKVEKKIKLDQG